MAPFSTYDEAFTDDTKDKIYILYTSMKFLQKNEEEVNKIHGFFFDLCKNEDLFKQSFYYIYDYDSKPDAYDDHGKPDKPRIVYFYKRDK